MFRCRETGAECLLCCNFSDGTHVGLGPKRADTVKSPSRPMQTFRSSLHVVPETGNSDGRLTPHRRIRRGLKIMRRDENWVAIHHRLAGDAGNVGGFIELPDHTQFYPEKFCFIVCMRSDI